MKQVPAVDKGAISILFRAFSIENGAVCCINTVNLELIPIVWSGSSGFGNLRDSLTESRNAQLRLAVPQHIRYKGETSTRPLGHTIDPDHPGGRRTTRHD